MNQKHVFRPQRQRMNTHLFDFLFRPVCFHEAGFGMAIYTFDHVRDLMRHNVRQQKRAERTDPAYVILNAIPKDFDVNPFVNLGVSQSTRCKRVWSIR